jgi:hypothetical protein
MSNLMHNHSEDLVGPFEQYRNNVLITNTPQVVRRNTLAAVNTRTGNHKDPNVHSFYSQKLNWPTGRRETWQSGFTIHDVEIGRIFDYGVPLDHSQDPSTASVYNKALKKLYDQLRDSDLNLTVDLAEIRQTYEMLRRVKRIFPQLLDYARKARSSARKKIRKYPNSTVEDAKNAIGNAWLEYRYGWKPLLSSIYGVMDFQRHSSYKRKLKARASTVNKWSTHVNATFSNVATTYWTTSSQRCEIGITYRVKQPELFNATRFASLNPLGIAWELLPYSFVVDWFIDIGGFLQMWEQSFFLGLEFEKGYVTYSRKRTTRGSYSGTRGSPTGSFFQTVEAPYKCVEVDEARTVLTSAPKPYLPRLDVNLGWQRILSGAALLNQILSPDPSFFRK